MKNTENLVYGVLISIIVILIVMKYFMPKKQQKSYYNLEPTDIAVQPVSPSGPQSIFDLPYKLDCVPGPTSDASNYTKSLTPGGICGAGQWVASQANYTITGGIGGNLLMD